MFAKDEGMPRRKQPNWSRHHNDTSIGAPPDGQPAAMSSGAEPKPEPKPDIADDAATEYDEDDADSLDELDRLVALAVATNLDFLRLQANGISLSDSLFRIVGQDDVLVDRKMLTEVIESSGVTKQMRNIAPPVVWLIVRYLFTRISLSANQLVALSQSLRWTLACVELD